MEIINTNIKTMYVDYKITSWRRVHFKDSANSKRIIESIKETGIDEIFDEDLGFTEQETLFEVDEGMTLEENNGFSTIEVYTEGKFVDNLIWSNGKN